MSLALRGAAWIAAYLAVIVAPLVLALAGDRPPGQGFLTDFSVALGFIGLSIMGLEFALVARFRATAAPFGQDAVVQFHRQMSYAGTAFILAHPLLLLAGDVRQLALFNPLTAPWPARFGLASILSLLGLMFTSVWRRRLRLRYEVWHGLHAGLATVAVLAALLHVQLVGYYVNTSWKQALWAVMTVAFVALIGWVRVVEPIRRLRRPWVVERVTAERGRTTTVTLRPVGHDGLRFKPGQFGWIIVGRSPFALTQHPFSFSSSAEAGGRIELSVKAQGDFTRSIRLMQPGTRAYIDGPHGVFTPDRGRGPGFVFIAGGVGITPMISMLRTFADRGEQRPCLLLYATRFLEEATFLEELHELRRRLDLTVLHIVQHATRDWSGERGRIDLDLLRRQLPRGYASRQFFISGPPAMIDAVEHALAKLAVPAAHVHTERFVFV